MDPKGWIVQKLSVSHSTNTPSHTLPHNQATAAEDWILWAYNCFEAEDSEISSTLRVIFIH